MKQQNIIRIPEGYPHFFNVSLKLILENERGEILGMKCKNEGYLAGFYDFPGGRINSDELQAPFKQIIDRELAEEVGQDVKYKIDSRPVSASKQVFFSNTLKRENCMFMVFFKAKYLGGEIKISDEHIGYKWLDLKKDSAEKYFTGGFLEGIKAYLRNLD